MKPNQIYTVDAFALGTYRGNPAGVCILESPQEKTWMQALASEMNLSETAFLVRESDGFKLRWFTPLAEVPLCGHATLASAHILWETGMLKKTMQAKFRTLSGILIARNVEDGWIELDFPAIFDLEEINSTPDFVDAIGAEPKFLGKFDFGSDTTYLVELSSDDALRRLQPDLGLLRKIEHKMFIVTSRASSECDFVLRVFAPALGIPEDPVTGSAQCYLGPFWSKRLGKNTFLVHQLSHRGGLLRVRLEQDRVKISGKARTIIKGEIQI